MSARTKLTLVGLSALVALPLAAPAASAAAAPKALRDYPAPSVAGKQMLDQVDAFASAHPLRITGTPVQLQATTDIANEARSLGYAVEVATYKGALQAVIATKKGTDRADESLVFGGHFDSMVGDRHL